MSEQEPCREYGWINLLRMLLKDGLPHRLQNPRQSAQLVRIRMCRPRFRTTLLLTSPFLIFARIQNVPSEFWRIQLRSFCSFPPLVRVIETGPCMAPPVRQNRPILSATQEGAGKNGKSVGWRRQKKSATRWNWWIWTNVFPGSDAGSGAVFDFPPTRPGPIGAS